MVIYLFYTIGDLTYQSPLVEYNSADYLHVFITLDELEKVLKLTKIGKTPGQGNINSELYKYAPEEFKQEVTTIFKQYIQRKSHSK